jgi:hypothetical protein
MLGACDVAVLLVSASASRRQLAQAHAKRPPEKFVPAVCGYLRDIEILEYADEGAEELAA